MHNRILQLARGCSILIAAALMSAFLAACAPGTVATLPTAQSGPQTGTQTEVLSSALALGQPNWNGGGGQGVWRGHPTPPFVPVYCHNMPAHATAYYGTIRISSGSYFVGWYYVEWFFPHQEVPCNGTYYYVQQGERANGAAVDWHSGGSKRCDVCFAVSTTNGVEILEQVKTGQQVVATIPNLQNEAAVAVNDDNITNELYVSNNATNASSRPGVAVYAPGTTKLERFLAADAPAGSQVGGITSDAAHNVYLSFALSGVGGIEEFHKGQAPGQVLGMQTHGLVDLAVDSKGNLIVCDPALPGIEVFPPGSSTPKLTFDTAGTPTSISLSANEKTLVVADPNNGTVSEFAYPSGALLATASPGGSDGAIPVTILAERKGGW